MMSVSGINTGAAQPLAAAGKAADPSKIRRTEESAGSRPPLRDEYIPEERQEPIGRYWKERDEEGRTKICFDNPERAAAIPKQQNEAPGPQEGAQNGDEAPRASKGPEKGGKKEERWAGNTDRVDREIESLKRKLRELEQRLGAETDEVRAKDLKRQLDQVERELRQKDNDTYRKAHSTFTQLS